MNRRYYHSQFLQSYDYDCIFRFDGPHLLNGLRQAGLKTNWIHGFVDTIVCFRHHYPNLPSYSLNSLLEMFDLDGEEHEAFQDAIDLREVVKAGMKDKNLTFEEFLKVGFKKVEQI